MTGRPIKAGSDIPHLLAALKARYRALGMRYVDLAASLGISQMTVKRYLSGRGLSLAVLEELCGVAGLSLIELSELAAQYAAPADGSLSEAQEQALAENHAFALVLHLLQAGWTPQEIQADLELADPMLVAVLAALDRLGFIELMPGNKTRLLSIRIPWSRNERLKRSFDGFLKEHFQQSFGHPEVLWRYRLVRLSPASLARIERAFEDLARTVEDLARGDRDLPRDQTCWQGVLLAVHPADLAGMLTPELLGTPPKGAADGAGKAEVSSSVPVR